MRLHLINLDCIDVIRYNSHMIDRIRSNSLRSRRQALGLTQHEVAKRSGLLQTNYSKIEQGKTDPRLSTLQDIARALSLEVMLVPSELVDTVHALTGQSEVPEDKPLFSAEPDSIRATSRTPTGPS
jgi:transcriptional regulator with XRE-family HTH domain